jgi:hypothetical protein
MKQFDLKKYLAENKATFHSSLNESYDEQEAHKAFDYHEKTGQLPPGMSEEEFEELMNKYNIKGYDMNDVPFYNMKESKLRSKIREMVLAEMSNVNEVRKPTSPNQLVYKIISKNPRFKWLRDELPKEFSFEDVKDVLSRNGYSKEYDYFMVDEGMSNVNEEESEYDFLAELEGMLDEKELNQKPTKKDKETEAADDITVDDTEDVEIEDTEIDTSEVDPNVKAVQDALTQAQAAAQSLGDQKLSNQIGNTITYFTRAHISKPNNLR